MRWQDSQSEGVGGGGERSGLGREDKNGAAAGEESEQRLQSCRVNYLVAFPPWAARIHSREELFVW